MDYHSIEFTKSFEKQFANLPDNTKEKFYTRLELFRMNPFSPVLNNHGLKGKYLGYRSIDIKGDMRALYRIKGDMVVIFAFIGMHS